MQVTLFKNHSGVVGYWKAWSEGGTVFIEHAKKLDGKPVVKQYTATAKNVGRANETTAEQQAVLEIESRAKKQLDKGYVRTEEEAVAPSTNSLGFEKPMLATPFEKVKPESIDWENAFAQPKLDGHRALFKDGQLYSRQGKVIDLPHVVEAIKQLELEHLHLDGELYWHGKSLQEISSLVKKLQPESAQLVYHVYDVVDPENTWTDRFFETAEVLDTADHDSVVAVPATPVVSNEILQTLHSSYLELGYEGTMLRHGTEGYADGKRAKQLLKLKNFQDAEFLVVGVNRGVPNVTARGTFEVPVWVCQSGDNVFTVTAQGNMHEKHAQWESREEHVGRRLTVKFHYMSKDEIPQLPVALRWFETI